MQAGNGLAALVAPVMLRAGGKSWADSARAGLAAFGGWQLAKIVKAAVPRGRPAMLLDDVELRDGDPDGHGFVSGHATVAMSLALAIAPTVGLPLSVAAVGTALAVSLARVHVGAHLPLDIVGAMGLAAVWGTVCAPHSQRAGSR